jgi:hypothetical protein
MKTATLGLAAVFDEARHRPSMTAKANGISTQGTGARRRQPHAPYFLVTPQNTVTGGGVCMVPMLLRTADTLYHSPSGMWVTTSATRR